MKIEQNYLLAGFGKVKIEALEDKILYSYKSLSNECSMEIDYNEIDPKPMRGKSADRNWWNVFYFFVAMSLLVSFIDSQIKVMSLVGLILIFAALISLCMLAFKQEFITYFKKNSEMHLFSIRNPNSPECKKFLDFVNSKINGLVS